MAEWEEKESERQAAYAGIKGGLEDEESAAEATAAQQFVAYVPLPDQKVSFSANLPRLSGVQQSCSVLS